MHPASHAHYLSANNFTVMRISQCTLQSPRFHNNNNGELPYHQAATRSRAHTAKNVPLYECGKRQPILTVHLRYLRALSKYQIVDKVIAKNIFYRLFKPQDFIKRTYFGRLRVELYIISLFNYKFSIRDHMKALHLKTIIWFVCLATNWGSID